MKDKLEKNMYVRTKHYNHIPSYISKIIKITDDYVKLENQKDTHYSWEKEDILKASHNIIDLIEENDYINGLRVEKNKYRELYTSYVYYGGDIGKQCEVYTTWLKDYKIEDIETIVTHEQIEQMEYRLGDDK